MSEGEKPCTRCRETKPFTDFNKSSKGKFGLRSDCRACQGKCTAKYLAENREACNARQRERLSRPEVKAQRSSYHKQWYKKNRERQIAKTCAWQRDNKDRVNAKSKAWRAENPEQGTLASVRRRARMAEVQHIPFTAAQLAQRWAYYGNKCWVCGDEPSATDHVKPIAEGGSHMLCNLRPICTPCNSSKGARWPIADWLPERKSVAA